MSNAPKSERVHDRFDVARLTVGQVPLATNDAPTARVAAVVQRTEAATLRLPAVERESPAPRGSLPVFDERAHAEAHDTIEVPPLVSEPLMTGEPSVIVADDSGAVPSVAIESDVSRPLVTARRDDDLGDDDGRASELSLRASSEHRADAVAAVRGLVPLRRPRRATTYVPPAGGARRLVVASALIAVVSLAVAVAAIVWACSVAARAERRPASVTAPRQ